MILQFSNFNLNQNYAVVKQIMASYDLINICKQK